MQTFLQDFKDKMAKEFFGITLDEAHSRQICIKCKAPTEHTDWSPEDIDEWLISGVCPTCFALLSKED